MCLTRRKQRFNLEGQIWCVFLFCLPTGGNAQPRAANPAIFNPGPVDLIDLFNSLNLLDLVISLSFLIVALLWPYCGPIVALGPHLGFIETVCVRASFCWTEWVGNLPM